MSDDIRAIITTRSGRKFAQMASGLPIEVQLAANEIGDDSELLLQAHALKGVSTRLAREIKSVHMSPGVIEVQSNAKNPETGYAYTGVTRFGHRRMWIEPKRRNSASVITTRKSRGRGRRANLRLDFGGGEILFRRKVRAYRPSHDWVQDAMPQIKSNAHRIAITLAKRIVSRFF